MSVRIYSDTLKPHNIRGFNRKNQKGGECYIDAYSIWIDMKYIGHIVKGYRKGIDIETPHYWLEVGDYVYTVGFCELKNDEGHKYNKWEMLSYKKDSYYNHFPITKYCIETEEESLLAIMALKMKGEM